MQQFLEVHNLLPKIRTKTDVYVIAINEKSLNGADQLVRKLREADVKVEFDFTLRKIDKQLKTAVKKGIPFAMFVGETELESGIYPIKNLDDSTEQQVDFDRVITTVKDHRYDGDEDSVFEI